MGDVLMRLCGLTVTLAVASTLQAPATKPRTDQDRLVALQLSEACRADGDKFWASGGYGKLPDSSYLTHYNRELERCLIRVSLSNVTNGVRSLMHEVYDAVQGDIVGREMIFLENGSSKIVSLDLPQTVPVNDANLAKFNALMLR